MLGWLKSIFFPHSLSATQELLTKLDLAGDPAVAPFQIFNPNTPWVRIMSRHIKIKHRQIRTARNDGEPCSRWKGPAA